MALDDKQKEEIFIYLEELRQSGKTNMYGAAAYIMGDFFLDRTEAQKILSEWMRRYDELSIKYGWQEA